jgi:hypothetical protein
MADIMIVEQEVEKLQFDSNGNIDKNVVINFISQAIEIKLNEIGYIVYNDCISTLENINCLLKYKDTYALMKRFQYNVLHRPIENKKENAKIELENRFNASENFNFYHREYQPNLIPDKGYKVPWSAIKEKTTEIDAETFTLSSDTLGFHTEYLSNLKNDIITKRIGIVWSIPENTERIKKQLEFDYNIFNTIHVFVKKLEHNYKGHYRVNYTLNLEINKDIHRSNFIEFHFTLLHCGFVVSKSLIINKLTN